MNIRVCDRCKKRLNKDNPMGNVKFPVVMIRIKRGAYDEDIVDLCEKCEDEVYKYIFGGGDDNVD